MQQIISVTPPPLIVVVGETASGKSALALALAEHFEGELICADSWTVYKGFNIGTAKPSVEEQGRIKHHLLDIADPAVGFSAVEFKKQAVAAIADIASRGKLPIMVGGTGLYIDSVLFDYQFLPAPPDGLRQELSALSLEQLQQKAQQAGLDTTDIDMRNKRRIIRLIENNGLKPTKQPLRDNTLMLGIAVDRDHLRQRVEARVDAMMAAGLEDEVKTLAERYGWEAEPMKGIGYREWQPYFRDGQGEQTIGQTRERIITATMGLAKRQRTWFRPNKSIHWLSANDAKEDTIDRMAEAVDVATTFLENF